MTQTLEETALLRAILADPLDDTVRLVYADWLDEQPDTEWATRKCSLCVDGKQNDCEPGDLSYNEWDCEHCRGTGQILGGKPGGKKKRAEYIRESVANPQHSIDLGGPGMHLYARDRQTILIEMHPILHGVVRRGFVAEVHCTLADWLSHGPAIVRTQPVEVVRATDRAPSWAEELWVSNWSWLVDPVEDGIMVQFTHPHFLPRSVWDCLGGFMSSPSPRVRARRYLNRETAVSALSAALLKWAKRQPGNG